MVCPYEITFLLNPVPIQIRPVRGIFQAVPLKNAPVPCKYRAVF